MGDDFDEYYPATKKDDGLLPTVVLLGGVALLGYILNNKLLDNEDMGRGRIYNNIIRNYAQGIQDLEDTPNFKRGIPSFPKQYRTHNITYPDIMYEGVRRQKPIENTRVSGPMPASDEIEFNYAEPSNIVTDNIIYEQGTPDIREDYRLTGVTGVNPTRFSRRTKGGLGEGASNTIFTTEYATGLNEKVRRDNPVVVTEVPTGDGTKVKRIARLAPWPKTHKRRFNTDYDEYGRPLQRDSPVYDTFDYLSDLKLTNEDFGEGEAGGRVSDDTLSAFEDFVVKGKLRQGYEIIPSED